MSHRAFVVTGLVAFGFVQSGSAAPDREPPPVAFVEANGVLYQVEKAVINGHDVKTYSLGGATFDAADFRAHVADQEPQIISLELQQALETAQPDNVLDLVVVLRAQPCAPISRAVRANIQPQIDELSAQIQNLTRAALGLPNQPLDPQQERHFQPQPLDGVAQANRRALAQQVDALRTQAMQQIYQQTALAVQPSQEALVQAVEQLGGIVTARISVMNILGVRLAAQDLPQLANNPLVAQIDLDHPGAPELDNHKVSLGLTTGFWPAGIDGGVHDVGVLDTGVQQSHPALSSHAFLSNAGATDTSNHGTGMAGILASTDATFRGMAFGCDTIIVAIAGTDTTSMTGMNYIVSTGEPENCNYSFGNGTATGTDYGNIDKFFDAVIDNFNYMVSKSTGNGGYSQTGITITRPAPAYNLLASANMDDFNTVQRSDDRITSSSSVGPTVAQRKKPDITAPGNNSMSCTPAGGFANIGGTSSAAPHTGGGIVLLMDLGVADILGAKAVLLNTTDAITDNATSTTADDVYVNGSLWNRRYGWGYLNLGAAYLHGLDVQIDQINDEPEDADFKLYKGIMFANERATLTWQRHVAYNGATYPTAVEDFSDLDLFAFREADNSSLAVSNSAVDSVEQLDVDSGGTVVLKVEAFGTFDPDITEETFALAHQENFVATPGPEFLASFTHPASVDPLEQFTLSVDITNGGDVSAHNVSVQLSGINIIAGPNPATLGSISGGNFASASWTVEAQSGNGAQPVSVAITSNSYGETFTGIGASTIQVGAGACIADITGDLMVDVNDLLLVIGNWGATVPPANVADVNGDLVVNVNDLLAVVGAWGPCS